jgi:DNA-directed RNA polymerase sigma subunit (sigma70/sigma32)
MTRSELAAWCVTVTDEREDMPELSSLEAAKEAYEAKKRAADVLTQAVREARKTHSLAEIAQELGVSRQRVHQISSEEK